MRAGFVFLCHRDSPGVALPIPPCRPAGRSNEEVAGGGFHRDASSAAAPGTNKVKNIVSLNHSTPRVQHCAAHAPGGTSGARCSAEIPALNWRQRQRSGAQVPGYAPLLQPPAPWPSRRSRVLMAPEAPRRPVSVRPSGACHSLSHRQARSYAQLGAHVLLVVGSLLGLLYVTLVQPTHS